MSKRKGKSTLSGTDKSKWTNKYNGSEVFRNSSAVCDDTDPHQSLKYLIEIFNGKVDEDVISMVFSECAFNVDQSLETLMSLSSDVNDTPPTYLNDIKQHSEKTEQLIPFCNESIQSRKEISQVNSDVNASNFHDKHDYFLNTDSATNTFDSLSFLSLNQSLSSDKSSKNESSSFGGSTTPLYNDLFPPSNLLGDTVSNSTSKNWASHKFDPTVPEFSPKFPYKNPPEYGTPKKYKGTEDSPKSNQLKRNNKKPSIEEVANQIKYARDLIKSGRLVLIILRGLPGSGKSTLAKNLRYSGVVFSTDDYFFQNGQYFFDPNYLQEAHAWNKNRALKALSKGISPVIIDNTNTEAWEMAPYVSMGKRHHFDILILEPITTWKFKPHELARRNQHGVRKEKIIQMLERYQHNITLESFAECSNLSTFKNKGKTISNISLPNHISNAAGKVNKTAKQSVSLEAVIHQEDNSHDSFLYKDIKQAHGSITSLSDLPLENEISSTTKNTSSLFSIKCPKCTEMDNDLENMACATKTKTFKSLEELKSLVQDDTEDTLSICSDCLLLQSTATEGSWEEVTEVDSDFSWKTPLQESSSNSSLNSLHLQSEIASVTSDDTASSKARGNSFKSEVPFTPSVSQRELGVLEKDVNKTLSLSGCCINSIKAVSTDKCPKPLSLQINKFDASLGDNINARSNLLSHPNNSSDDIFLDALSSFDENNEKAQINQNLLQNLNSQESDQNFHKILTKNEDVLAKKYGFENAEGSKSSSRKLSSRSFDESLVFRESKTKEIEKNIETNLLRSKFHSVPLFENQLDVATNSLDSVSKSVEKQIDFKNSLKFCLEQKTTDTHLWISDDVDEIIPLNDQQSQSLNSFSSLTKSDAPTWDKDCNHNLIRKKDSFSEMNPKPQRNNLKIGLSATKNNKIIDSIAPLSFSDYGDTESVLNWDDSVKIEETSQSISNESLPSPKPQKSHSEFASCNKVSKFTLDTKNEEKDNQIWDSSSSLLKTPNTSFGPRKRSPLLKNVEKYMNSDWSFPQFFSNISDTNIISEPALISTSNVETQTEPSDFVQMYKIETCGIISNYRIVTSSINIINNSEIDDSRAIDFHEVVPQIAKFEKSTSTEGLIADTEVSQKMTTLQECFPDVSEDDLQHLLNLCHEDEAWMINLLLDSGYKYNNPNPEEIVPSSFLRNSLKSDDEMQKTEIHNQAEIEMEHKDLVSDFDKNCNVSQNSETLIKTLESQTDLEMSSNCIPNSSTFEKMHFTLDPAFAIQLEELFGPVAHTASASPSERTVEIDFEFARLIYDKWKNTVQSDIFTNIVDTEKKSKKNKNLQLSGQKKKENNSTLPQISNEPTSFSEIMDMEYALQIHKSQKLKKDTDIATKLKRIELYNLFPGADPIALDEIFEANNCCLKNSVLALGEDLGKASAVKEREFKNMENINESNKLKILQEFENDDWSDWVSKENEYGNEVSLSTISPEAEELRNKAAKHYGIRQEFIQKAQNANGRGMKEVAAFYAEMGREHGFKFKEANKAACDLIFQQRNALVSAQILDIHGLFVQEAIPRVKEFLKIELQRKPSNCVTKVSIITGQGNHSVQGPKLRPSVIEFLRKSGYKFSEVNRGLLEVYLGSE